MSPSWRSARSKLSVIVHTLYVTSPFRLRPGEQVDEGFRTVSGDRQPPKIGPKVYCREYIAYSRIEGCAGGGAMEAQSETPEDGECSVQPSVFYLLGTLLLTSCSTAMLCAAIMTEHWEHVSWEAGALARLANSSRIELQWLLDGKVAKIAELGRILNCFMDHLMSRGPLPSIEMLYHILESMIELPDRHHHSRDTFLVPMNGGIWTLCISLEDEELELLTRVGFPERQACYNYLAGDEAAREELRADWQHRMQNLSISCALVCLIVLGTAALVGAFGICKHQISAVLVTGVMYLLAGLFALFTLMIIHFKRQQRSVARGAAADGTADGVVGARQPAMLLLDARDFSTAWSLELGWAGVGLTALTSVLWILLSKIMRFNPISAILL